MNETPEDNPIPRRDLTQQTGRVLPATKPRTNRVFNAILRAGYHYGSGDSIVAGPAEVSIPIDPNPATNHPGLRGYLHMIDNEEEARRVLNMPIMTFLSARDAATEQARTIAAATVAAQSSVARSGQTMGSTDIEAIVQQTLEKALPAVTIALGKTIGEAVGTAIAAALASGIPAAQAPATDAPAGTSARTTRAGRAKA